MLDVQYNVMVIENGENCKMLSGGRILVAIVAQEGLSVGLGAALGCLQRQK